jgi:hypothetical protein
MIYRIARIAVFLPLAVLLSALLVSSGGTPAAKAQPHSDRDLRCKSVGGSIITKFGAVDPNTTLDPATGDLRGAVAATLISAPQPGPNGTVIFHIQHHWVTESGDNITTYFANVVRGHQLPNPHLGRNGQIRGSDRRPGEHWRSGPGTRHDLPLFR